MIADGGPGAAINAVIWALCGILTGVPVLLILRNAMDGGLDGAIATAAIFGILCLTGATLATAGTVWVFAPLALLLAICVVTPFFCTVYNKKLHEQMDEDDIAKYHAALQRDSRNSGAHALLGEAYLKKGFYVEAVAHFEAAITLSPDSERNPNLLKWTRKLEKARIEKAEWEVKNAVRRRV